jgi:hypothetical protein
MPLLLKLFVLFLEHRNRKLNNLSKWSFIWRRAGYPTSPAALLEAGGRQKYVQMELYIIAAPAIHILLPSLEAARSTSKWSFYWCRAGHPYSPAALLEAARSTSKWSFTSLPCQPSIFCCRRWRLEAARNTSKWSFYWRRAGHPYSLAAGDRRPLEVRPNGALISAVLDTSILVRSK